MRVIADRYELRESLGHGGMARVYLAADRILDRLVAVKLLRDDIGRDDVLRERFLREARLAGGLNHRSIVRVYDAGVDADTPWIAMELVEGPSLREAMSSRGRYPAAGAVALISEILDALGAAHAAGVVHRDIKPANVLLAADGPKLSDFGIAKSQQGGADLTQTNQFMGTPKYTAPEVAIGYAATPQADVYSAAVVLWEMLAGFPPYEHDNPLSLAMMHRTDPLPSLVAARPDLPATLVAAIEAGLAKEPPDRPVDAATFAAMLTAGLAGAPGHTAATAPTAALPRIPVPAPGAMPPPHERTMAMPAPLSAGSMARGSMARGSMARGSMPAPSRPGRRAPAGRPRPPARPTSPRNVVGISLVVGLLLLVAAFAFTQLDGAATTGPTEMAPSTVPTPTPTPTATTVPVTPAPAAPPVVTTEAEPEPEPEVEAEPDPNPEPTTPPTIAPELPPVQTPEPDPTQDPTPDPAPEPTATPTPLPSEPAVPEIPLPSEDPAGA